MKKEKKNPKADKYHLPATRALIRRLLKEEKKKSHVAGHFGFGAKATQMIIDRWGLEEKLLIPRLVGVR